MAALAGSANWLTYLKEAKKTCIVQDGRRKAHYKFKDDKEMVEEYDVQNNDLILRKWKENSTLRGGKWVFEIGDDLLPRQLDSEGMVESTANPLYVRRDTKKAFQWRIRNLPYPLETYSVKINTDERNIIVRTSNKKYYKKINIPDLERLNVELDEDRLSYAHANNTLIITYEKPAEVLNIDKEVQKEFRKIKANKEGDVECPQS